MPDVNEKLIESIQFKQLSLELDETFSTKQFIRVFDKTETADKNEDRTNNNNNEKKDDNSL